MRGAYLSGTQTKYVAPSVAGKHGELLLSEFSRQWTNHRTLTEWMRRMFMFIDLDSGRAGAPKREVTLTSMSLRKFNELIFEKKKGALATTLVQLINRDRDGESVDRCVLCEVVVVVEVCEEAECGR